MDENFNLKIADFGFAGPIAGRHGDGYLTTRLGTKPYEAPEILEGKKYLGAQVDLFAAAVVLFILVAGTPPFNTAEEKDYYYKMLLKDRADLFWKCHIKGK